MTLIISGAVLGAIAGFLQQIYTVASEKLTGSSDSPSSLSSDK